MITSTCIKCGSEFDTYPCHVTAGNGKGTKCKACRARVTRITVQCANCGARISRTPGRLAKQSTANSFCSYGCLWAWNAAHNIGAAASNFKGGLAAVNCAICGSEKLVCQGEAKKPKKFLCSQECLCKWRSTSRIGNTWKGPRIFTDCGYCGRNIPTLKCLEKKLAHRFCDRKCFAGWAANRLMERNSNWKGGKSFEPYPTTWNSQLRERIRDRDGRSCRVCGKTELENGRKLSVHHIDYDKSNVSNENLVSLCARCHSATNGNREFWKSLFSSYSALGSGDGAEMAA